MVNCQQNQHTAYTVTGGYLWQKNELDITTLTPEQRDARLALDVERLLRFGRKNTS